MSIRAYLDDLIALAGLISLLTGIYLWIGLPPTLILLGVVLIFIGIRIQPGTGKEIPENE